MRHPGFTIPANDEVIEVTIEPMGEVVATTFDIEIANVSTPGTLTNQERFGGAVPLSPGVFAVYTGDTNPAFAEEGMADAGTEIIAEDGFTAAPLGPEAETLATNPDVRVAGVFSQPAGNVPALEPGESTSFSIAASPGDRLALETMFVQSNDWFYGLDGLALFDDDGQPISGDVTSEVTLYDAGTEADTAPGTGPDQKPAQEGFTTNQGPAESVPIQPARDRHGDTFTIPSDDQVIRITITPR
jgi:hypothetical protein